MLKKLLVLTAILALALVASPAMATQDSDAVAVTLVIDDFCYLTAATPADIVIAFTLVGSEFLGSGDTTISFTWGSNVVGTITAEVTTESDVGTLTIDDLDPDTDDSTSADSDVSGPKGFGGGTLSAASGVADPEGGTVLAEVGGVTLAEGSSATAGGVVTISCTI